MAGRQIVDVVGLKAMRRDVKKLTGNLGDLDKALAAAGRAALEPVAAATRAALPQVTGRLAGDVRITARGSTASLRMGRASVRYAGWVEFGGTRRVPHVSTRPYDPRGRYMFPAAIQLAPVAAQLFTAATEKTLNQFGWTNSTTSAGSVHD